MSRLKSKSKCNLTTQCFLFCVTKPAKHSQYVRWRWPIFVWIASRQNNWIRALNVRSQMGLNGMCTTNSHFCGLDFLYTVFFLRLQWMAKSRHTSRFMRNTLQPSLPTTQLHIWFSTRKSCQSIPVGHCVWILFGKRKILIGYVISRIVFGHG